MAGILLVVLEPPCDPLGGLRLGGAVETDDAMHVDLGDGLLRAVLGRVLARLDLTHNLNVCTFGEAGGVFGGTSKSDALMPGGLRFAGSGLTVLPSALGREREDRQS
jgi:hypothetical protein